MIDFNAEARRLRGNGAAMGGPFPAGTAAPLAPVSPVMAFGRLGGGPPQRPVRDPLALNMTAKELAAFVRDRSADAHALDAPFHSFFHAWPLLGRHSPLAVIRHHYMVHVGREPTFNDCDRYLRSATTQRLNSGELRCLIAVDEGLRSPLRTLSRGARLQRLLGGLARRLLGKRAVPFRFTASALAQDAFVLDLMRLTSAMTRPEPSTAARSTPA